MEERTKRAEIAIFVLIDALGWQYVERSGFVLDIAPDRKRLKTTLSYSSGAIPSIISGKYPADHGHWSYFYHSPTTSPFKWMKPFGWLPSFVEQHPLFRRVLTRASRKIGGFRGYFSLYNVPLRLLPLMDYCEKKSPLSLGGLNRGNSIFDLLSTNHVSYTALTYPLADSVIMDQAIKSLSAKQDSFMFLYLTEVDAFLHRHCNDEGKVATIIEKYDNFLRRLWQAANEVYSQVNLYIFSDHGMVPTNHTHDLMSEMKTLRLKVPEDYVPMYDATMARFWFRNTVARERVVSLLASRPYGTLLSDNELKRNGIFFPDAQFGQCLFLTNPGELLEPTYMYQIAPAGMHGYDPDYPGSDGMLISNGKINQKVNNITDVFRIMAEECGLW